MKLTSNQRIIILVSISILIFLNLINMLVIKDIFYLETKLILLGFFVLAILNLSGSKWIFLAIILFQIIKGLYLFFYGGSISGVNGYYWLEGIPLQLFDFSKYIVNIKSILHILIHGTLFFTLIKNEK